MTKDSLRKSLLSITRHDKLSAHPSEMSDTGSENVLSQFWRQEIASMKTGLLRIGAAAAIGLSMTRNQNSTSHIDWKQIRPSQPAGCPT